MLEGEGLNAILSQVRSNYILRSQRAFPYSLAFIGTRDVREYRSQINVDRKSFGDATPFNIKAQSLQLANFNRTEVTALYQQHTEETGQQWTDEAMARAYELTQGQPWLVNALARQIIERDAIDRSTTINAAHVNAAKETLILRRDTHIDSLAERLHEARVRRVIEPVLTGSFTGAEVYNDDLLYVADLGLTTRPPAQIKIANPIYAEVIPRSLSFVMQSNLPLQQQWYVLTDGRLDMIKLLREFQQFFRRESEIWLERYEYKEAGPHLLLYAWLQRVVNGGGHLHRESALGNQRVDLLIEWPVTIDSTLRRWPIPPGVSIQREVLEVKLYRDKQTEADGLEQLGNYLTALGEPAGHLLIFDRRLKRSWDKKIFRRDHVVLPAPHKNLYATIWGL